jgi:hypothetical protein
VTEFGKTMTAARSPGKPLFCETTRTTVTVSDPNATPGYARGTSTAAMLVSADGGIGGVVGPDWRSMVFLTVAPSGASEQTEAFIKDGLFVAFTQMATGTKARFTVRQTEPGHPERPIYEGDVSTPAGPGETVAGQSHPELNLPAPAAALVATTDRPIPDPDLSDKGRFLAECIANSDSAVVDPQLWEAVTITGTAPYRAVLARAGQEAVGCSMQGNRTDRNDPNVITPHYTFTPPFVGLKADRPVQFVVWQMIGTENAQAVLGLLRPDVASMELDGPDLDATPVPIESGAFAFTAPAPRDGGPLPELTVVLRNAAGAEIYRGPVSP